MYIHIWISILVLALSISYYSVKTFILRKERITKADIFGVRILFAVFILAYIAFAVLVPYGVCRFMFKIEGSRIFDTLFTPKIDRLVITAYCVILAIPLLVMIFPITRKTSQIVLEGDDESVIPRNTLLVWLNAITLLTIVLWSLVLIYVFPIVTKDNQTK
jgi:hypothetical protein